MIKVIDKILTKINSYRKIENAAELSKSRKTEMTSKRSWGYSALKIREVPEVKEITIQPEIVIDEKVIGRRPKLDTVKDLDDLSLFENISLVRHFNDLESGRHDERLMREEYAKNSDSLRRVNSLKFFLLETAKRNLEHGEFYSIEVPIDPRFRNEFYECSRSKLLASYEIKIIEEHDILTRLEVEPIVISMRLKSDKKG